MAADWSTLPLDLLREIAFKLESCDDFIYFSAVCRSWNHASSSIKNLWTGAQVPWLLLVENNNVSNSNNCVRNMLNLKNNKRYSLNNIPEMFGARCWGTPYGWVAVAKRDLSVELINPITKANISFPSLQTIPGLSIHRREDFEETWFDLSDWYLAGFLEKLVVLKVSPQNEFVIMLLGAFSQGPFFAKHGDESWTTLLFKEAEVRVFDVVVMDDLVFALCDYEGAIVYWSVREFYGPGVVEPMVYSTAKYSMNVFASNAYLVQSGSDLLMVIRVKLGANDSDDSDDDDYYETTYRTTDFKIIKLNPNDKTWENVKDFGDVALLVGDNSSMSVSSAHAKGLQHSCIYFTDDGSEVWLYPKERIMLAGLDMGVFNVRTNHIQHFYKGNDTRSSVCSPTLFIPHF